MTEQELLQPSALENSVSDESLKWYAVITASGMEKRAKEILLDLIKKKDKQSMFGQIVIPVQKEPDLDEHGMQKRDKAGQPKFKDRKIMPGYMLIQMNMTEDTCNLVKSCPKIADFVNGTKRMHAGQSLLPSPLGAAEVDRMLNPTQSAAQAEVVTKGAKVSFDKGERVKVIDGPFTNFIGDVEEVRADKQRLRLLVSVFGRPTPVEIEFSKVEKVKE